MYSFYDDVLKPKYDENIKLVYTDTDSYVLKINTYDLYEDLKDIGEYMDFSDYHPSHPNHGRANKKVLGKIKDELNGKTITSFIGLKPKSYCYKVYSEEKMQEKQRRNKTSSAWSIELQKVRRNPQPGIERKSYLK